MRCSEADDRPTEDTNRKSIFSADKTLHIIAIDNNKIFIIT